MQIQPHDLKAGDNFGISLAIDDQVAVVEASNPLGHTNAAYVFAPVQNDNRTVDTVSSVASLSSTWTQTAKFTGATNSSFGSSVAVSGNWIVVGAFNQNGTGALTADRPGAVFVFAKPSSGSWTQIAQLMASNGANGDHFGRSVSISKDAYTIVVGAEKNDYNTAITKSGAAYLFRAKVSSTTVEWRQVEKIVAGDRDTDDNLGSSLAIDNNILVVGARGDDEYTGAVYVVDTGFSPNPTQPTISVDPTKEPPSSSKSDLSGFSIASIVIAGVVISLIALGFINRRRKRQLHGGHQAANIENPTPSPSTSSSSPQSKETNISTAAMFDDETPIMADAIIVPLQPSTPRLTTRNRTMPIRPRTMVARAFVDPTATPEAPAKTGTDAVYSNPDSTTNSNDKPPQTYLDQSPTRVPSGGQTSEANAIAKSDDDQRKV
jgi:hypothetical protein